MPGIILWDNDRLILTIETDIIEHLTEESVPDAELIFATTSPEEVICYLEANPGIYLYFIDLDFKSGSLNGIDVAKQIIKKEPRSKIVFVTNHHEMALKVLKSGVEPFGFITKSGDTEEMKRSYLQYIQLCSDNMDEPFIILSLKREEKIKVLLSDILYIETVKTASHCIAWHILDHPVITVRGTIEQALQDLGDGFIRSHRSVLVNKKHIAALEDGMVRFKNGETAACSFRQRNAIKRVLN